jgi:hypothetical protein
LCHFLSHYISMNLMLDTLNFPVAPYYLVTGSILNFVSDDLSIFIVSILWNSAYFLDYVTIWASSRHLIWFFIWTSKHYFPILLFFSKHLTYFNTHQCKVSHL